MEDIISLIVGFILLGVVGYDFFFTTLSGSGAAMLTQVFSALAYKLQMILSKIFGRKIFSLSGMLINLSVLAIWLLIAWIGAFLIFSSNPDAIVNSSGKTASSIERLYFTGYILSTLGIGDFKPTTPFFELLTSLFSFFGFVFFTTAMTYLVSISSAVMHKRSLALTIRTLGTNPAEVVRCLVKHDTGFSNQQISHLQQMVCRHSVNHQTYPVLHYYNNPDITSSLSINITILDEAVSILMHSKTSFTIELQPLQNALDLFLQHVKQKYGDLAEADDIPEINWFNVQLPEEVMLQESEESSALVSRRRILGGLLRGEGFDWHDIYPEQALKST